MIQCRKWTKTARRGRGLPRKDRHLGELRQPGAPPCADLLDLANWVRLAVARAMVATLPPDAYHAADEILRQMASRETFSRSDPQPEPLPVARSLNLRAQRPG